MSRPDNVVAAVDAQDIRDVKVMTNIVSLRCRVRCVRHFTRDIVVSWEHRRCAIVYISQHYQCVTVLWYNVDGLRDGLVIHLKHELESKLIFGWTTSK